MTISKILTSQAYKNTSFKLKKKKLFNFQIIKSQKKKTTTLN